MGRKLRIRATSPTRLRAHDHYTQSTLIGGKGGTRPSLLHTTLEGPTEYICECKMDVKSTRATVSRFCVRPTSKRWFLKIVQVTMKRDPFDAR